MTTIKLTTEEHIKLNSIKYFDYKEQWKKMGPYFYRKKDGYYEIYSKEEFEIEKQNNKIKI